MSFRFHKFMPRHDMHAQHFVQRAALVVAGHEVWDSMNVSISTSVLVSGAVSAWGLLGLLASTAGAGQAERSISLLLTVLLMGAWMFVNWCAPALVPASALPMACSLPKDTLKAILCCVLDLVIKCLALL